MDKNYYALYHQMEQEHWWFKARAVILESQVQKIAQKYNRPLTILNVGVATGATTKMLEKFGDVVSVEYDKDCCEFLKSYMDINPVNASMTALPFKDCEFDLVCAFDVIEHIEEDDIAINETYRVLNDNGTYIFTVPAFMFLWSDHDVVNHHFRRYNSKELLQKIKNTGLTISYHSYFNSILFLPIAFIRLIANLFKSDKKKEYKSDFESYKIRRFSNWVLFRIFLSERVIFRNKITMPFGVSIFATGTKSS
jgi:SAM-dependent methyltransferase